MMEMTMELKRATEIGSISSGTLRTEDLLDAFADELEFRVQDNAEAWCSDEGRRMRDFLLGLVWEAREIEDYDSDEASELVAQLMSELCQFAPDDAYFGSHPGDGADFGYWYGETDDVDR
jgi:hypothetical protein